MTLLTTTMRGLMLCLAKLPGIFVWLVATGLTVYLVSEFTEGQSPVIIGIALIAIMIGSFGLLYARYAWRHGAKPEAIGGLASWLLASSLLLFLELGFWSSSVSISQEQYQDQQRAKAGVEAIMSRDRAAITAGRIGESPGEIKAQMDAQLARDFSGKTLGRLTEDCSDTRAWAYRHCGDFLALKSRHAAAENAARVERRVWDAGTRTEAVNVKRNLFAGADWLSKNVGGSADGWAFTITVVFITLLWLARDGSLVITFAPRRRAEARTAAKPVDAIKTPEKLSSPVSDAVAALKQARPDLARKPFAISMSEADFAAFNAAVAAPAAPNPELKAFLAGRSPWDDETPPPDGGRSASKETVPSVRLAVNNDPPAENRPKSVPGKKKLAKRAEGSVVRWLSECTSSTPDKRVKVTTQECRRSYLAWCEARDMHPMGHKQMSRIMAAQRVATRGPRGGKGAVWLGLHVVQPNSEPLRMKA